MKELKNIEYFIFDLDGTCYQQLEEVFGQVSKRMGEFISKKINVDLKKAKDIQKEYFYKYNTTLNGLILKNNIDPHEFLKYVHDIDISFLQKDKILRKELIKLKAKKYIFTNGSHDHIINVTKHLGIEDLFDGMWDIVDSNFKPKPLIEPYKMTKVNNDILRLNNPYPNPFNPITTIQYHLPERSNVSINIYDMNGRFVKNLIKNTQNAGLRSIQWDATNHKGLNVTAGVYLYKIEAGIFIDTKKMVLLK